MAAPASAATIPPPEATAEQLAANDRAAATGEILFRSEQAVWRAAALFEQQGGSAREWPVAGYLTEPMPDGLVDVVFYAAIGAGKFELARYSIVPRGAITGGLRETPQAHPLSPALERMITARDAALALAQREQVKTCNAQPANVLILPPDGDDLTAVYLMTAPDKPGSYPLSGHYLFMVDAAGVVQASRRFQDGCFDAPVIPPGTPFAPDKYQFAHVLDPQPTEIHHLVAHYTNIPVEIGIENHLWVLDYTRHETGQQSGEQAGEPVSD